MYLVLYSNRNIAGMESVITVEMNLFPEEPWVHQNFYTFFCIFGKNIGHFVANLCCDFRAKVAKFLQRLAFYVIWTKQSDTYLFAFTSFHTYA
jgi:hypothetical protein